MLEVLFLFSVVIAAIVLTLPEKSPIRRAVVTFPFFVQTALRQRSLKKAVATHLPNVGRGGCKGGGCGKSCGKDMPKPSAEQIRLFQEQMAQMEEKRRLEKARQMREQELNPTPVAIAIPDEDELD